MKLFSLLLVLLSLAIPPSFADNPLEKIDIGYSRLRISLPIFVAKEEGIFEKHGIDANLVMYETAQPLMAALIEGKINVAGYTALPITYNGMLRNKKDLLFLSLMIEDQQHRISYLLKKKNDTSITSIKDLKGKRIGILPTIAYKAWITEILKQNKISKNDIQIQQVAPTQQAILLKSGGVDALFTNDPAATSAIESGAAQLISKDVSTPKYLGEPFIFGSFNISKKWAKENPELTNKIHMAIDEAIQFIKNNQAQSKQHMKKYLPTQFQAHVTKYPNALYWPSTKVRDTQLNNIAKQYFNIGIIPQKLQLKGAAAH